MNEETAAVRAQLESARKLAAGGDLRNAIAAARKATELAAALGGEPAKTAEAEGAAFAELGLLLQRAGDARRARDAYTRAEQAAAKLSIDDGPPHHRLLAATTAVNLASLLTKERVLDQAAERIDHALTLLEPVQTSGAVDILRLSALQNRAAIEAELRQTEAAAATLEQALAIGEGVVKSAPQLLPQLVEVAGRLATALRTLDRASEAVATAEKSARWAEAAYESGSPMGLPLYVSTQLQLVDANYAAGRYAEAEDHIWKAVEVSPGPQTLLVGTGFYCSLLRRSDDALTEGGLPRAEVVEAMDELVEKIAGNDPPADLLRLVRARRAVLVERDASAGESALSEVKPGSPLVSQLLQALSSDVAWVREASA